MDGQGNSPMEALPDTLLLHSILPLLDILSLGRLACCSRRLSEAAVVDHLWFPICRSIESLLTQHDWRRLRLMTSSGSIVQPPPEPWRSWHQLFCYKQNRRCIECREHTSYVYTLSVSRFPLCERCEHACPKYSLVTQLEAKGRYLLTDEDLRGLSYKKVCHKRFSVYFFLKSDIERVSSGKGVKLGHRDGSYNKGEQAEVVQEVEEAGSFRAWMDHQGIVTAGEGSSTAVQETMEDLQLHTEVLNLHGLSEGSLSDDDVLGSSPDTGEADAGYELEAMRQGDDMGERAHKKELRKEHKRQVKAAQRERRILRSTGVSVLSSSPDSGIDSSHKTYGSGLARRNAKVGRRQTSEPNVQLNPEAVQSTTKPLEIINKEKSKKKKMKTKREHVPGSGGYRQGETIECNLKWKTKSPSDWVREREWLEVELGPYGFSALELAPHC